MEVDIILEPDLGPTQLVELATAAEKYGIRALWTSRQKGRSAGNIPWYVIMTFRPA